MKIARQYLEEVDPADSLMESITRRMLHMFKVGYEVAELDEKKAWQEGFDAAMQFYRQKYEKLKEAVLEATEETWEPIND